MQPDNRPASAAIDPKVMKIRIDWMLESVRDELEAALGKFPSFNSPHEGKAVIEEELDELWQHVKANTGRSGDAQEEAFQVAAMALRYVLDLCCGSAQPEPSTDEFLAWASVQR